MYNPTPRETTPNEYQSSDDQVLVRVLQHVQRYPDHDYQVVVLRLQARDHTRVRHLGRHVFEYLPTKEEIKALLQAMEKVDPEFKVHIEKPLVNKSEERKKTWQARNSARVQKYRYHSYRRYYRRRY